MPPPARSCLQKMSSLLWPIFGTEIPSSSHALRQSSGRTEFDNLFSRHQILLLLINRKIPCKPVCNDAGQARIFFVKREMVDIREQMQFGRSFGALEHLDRF